MAALVMGLSMVLLAQDDAMDVRLDQDAMVAAVGYRLARANRDACPLTMPVTGLLLHDISAYDKGVRPSIERRFHLGYGLGVRAVIAGSAADRAGLRTGDVIVNIGTGPDTINIADADRDLIRDKADPGRTKTLEALLAARLQTGPQHMTVQRSPAMITVTLASETGCAGHFQVMAGLRFDAWSDGHDVAITQGALAEMKRPDELAFILGHEMGHNWIDQAKKLPAKGAVQTWFTPLRVLPVGNETQADLIGITAMRQAGYDPAAAIDILSRLVTDDDAEHKSKRKPLLARIALLKDFLARHAESPR